VGILAATSLSATAAASFGGSAVNPATGQTLSATADFDILSGNQLKVTLSNVGDAVLAPSDILTAVFFDLNGVGTLTPVSAVLNTGSILLNGPAPAGTTLGDYWAYQAGLSGVPNGATRGIAGVGFGLFGQGNFGANSQNVDGFDYGIIHGDGSTGNDHIPTTPLENNSVVFTLSGLPANFTFSDIGNVGFQYGTTLSPSEPFIPAEPVPEPSGLLAVGLLLALFYNAPRRLFPQQRSETKQ
jgi:hypothetical protein